MAKNLILQHMEKNRDKNGTGVGQITLAGGCFWNIEAGFRRVPGILATVAGYTGGDREHPDYTEVSTGTTGHVEAVRIAYDPASIDLMAIFSHFFSLFDPTAEEVPAGCDGSQYRSVIFCHTEEDCRAAETFIRESEASGNYAHPITTVVQPAGIFWPAEDYHQQYYEKLGARYQKPLF
jgi:methionine-S-sulfoxide reductase